MLVDINKKTLYNKIIKRHYTKDNMAYNELIKNFEKIREYMRDFYVYGFKSRDNYDTKSLRSYDDEKRRIESWLGKFMRFTRTSEGKNVFISIDSRNINHNPFYNALKAKSFTDVDITLHFILFDILYQENVEYSLSELMNKIDNYLSYFTEPLVFDESTLRKKLKEYVEIGIITTKKQGKHLVYSRAKDEKLDEIYNVVDFYSEIAPCGVIGSFLLDKNVKEKDIFYYKHHYIQSAIDSDVLCTLFLAMQTKCAVTIKKAGVKSGEQKTAKVIPLKVRISVQDGRQYLIAYQTQFKCITAYRIDYISSVKIEEYDERFDVLRKVVCDVESKTWGVSFYLKKGKSKRLEHVEFTIKVEKDEDYIVQRLEREKRIGKVEKVDQNHYRFSANVYDSNELIPWIRTFICRIVKLNFSNRVVENRLKQDIKKMYEIYGIKGE